MGLKGFDWQAFLNTMPDADPDLVPSVFGLQLLAVDDATGAINLILPPQTGHAGDVLTTDGSSVSWETPTGGGGGGGTWGSITGTLADQTDLQSALDAKQASDADLTAIAALTASNDDIIQRKAGAWTNRTIAQLKTDLSLSGSNTGDQDLTGYQTKAGTLALAGFGSITGTLGTGNIPDLSATYQPVLGFTAENVANKRTSFQVTPDDTHYPSEKLVYDQLALKGSGTVTSFSAGDLSPLFTTIEATVTTTPALTFSLSTQTANKVFAGPTTGADAGPTFRSLVAADIPDLSATYQPKDTDLTTWAGITPGTGVGTALAINVGSSGSFVTNGGALGTPSSGSAANLTSFPTLNQNTTGSAASLSISGQTGLLTFTGLASTNRAKTVRDAADTILELGGSYTPTGTWTNMTLVTPALGTPSAIVLTNATGSPTGISLTKAQLNTIVSDDDPAYVGTANTFTAQQVNSYSSTASTPAMLYSGTVFTGGTGTTTKPHLLIEPAGTSSTAWLTTGTMLGVNGASGFVGRLIDLQSNGASVFRVVAAGTVFASDNFTTNKSFDVGNGWWWCDGVNGASGGVKFGSGHQIKWNGAATTWGVGTAGTPDTGIARNAAGVVEVNNGTAGTLRDITARAHIHGGVTVANLPASPVAGSVAYVTDGSGTPAWGDTVTGGGSTKILVWYNGSAWTAIGK